MPVAVPVAVPLGVWLLVPLLLLEIDPVLEADAPAVTDDVGVTLTVVLALTVEEGVGGGVLVAVPVAVQLALGVPLGVWLPAPLLLLEMDPVFEADALGVGNGVGEGEPMQLTSVTSPAAPLAPDNARGPKPTAKTLCVRVGCA